MSAQRHRDTFIRWKSIPMPRSDIVTEQWEITSAIGSTEASILRVPAEIIAEIFLCAQLITPERNSRQVQMYQHLSWWCWITIAHVCRHWREIALGTQELWTYINIQKLSGPSQTAEYIARAGTSLLTVLFDGWGNNSRPLESFYMALKHISRIGILRISSSQKFTEELYDYIFCPAPFLEGFTFDGSESHNQLDMRPFFSGQAPNLKSLSLRSNLITWKDVPIIQNLRRLCITNSAYSSASETNRFDLQDLFTIISQNTKYESLSIHSISPPHDPLSLLEIQPAILLSSLKSLEIMYAKYSVLSQLFRKVDLPQILDWNICCQEFPIKSRPKVDPKGAIPCHSPMDTKPLSLSLNISNTYIKIVASGNDAGNTHPLQRSITYRWPSVQFVGEEITFSDIFSHICSVFRGDFWCSATELTVEIDKGRLQEDSVEGWKALLKLLPNLQKITVRYIAYRNILERRVSHRSLLGSLDISPGNINDNTICPNLSELHLSGFDLESSEEIERTLEPLKNRSKLGKELPLLCVSHLPICLTKNFRILKESGVAHIIKILESPERDLRD